MMRIIAVLVFGGFGFVLFYVGLTQFVRQRRLLRNARPIDAIITHSEVFSSTSRDTDPRPGRGSGTTTHRPDVRFLYEFDGHTYESDLLYSTIIVRTYASRTAAAEALAPYPVNARVPALVDPESPDKAFLIATPGAGPVVFIVVGALLPVIAWFVGGLI